MQRPIVFVIGAPRSGTTWLQSLLGSDPAVVTPQETDLFAGFIAPLQRWWDGQVGRTDDEQRAMRMKGLPAVIDDAEFHGLLAAMIERVLVRIAALDPSAGIIVEKSPSHSRHVELIRSFLPQAGFVHIIRDGRDVASSLESAARGWGSSWASDRLVRRARTWVQFVNQARVAAEAPRYAEVRYEALRSGDPEPLRAAFAICGLDVDEAHCEALLAEYSLERMARGSTPSPIVLGGAMAQRHGAIEEPSGFYGQGATGGWTSTWTSHERLVFDTIAGDLLIELGYEPDHTWSGSSARRARFRASNRAIASLAKLGRNVGRYSEATLRRLP